MVVMAREAWTGERLDDLNRRVEGVDRRMEAGFREIRMEFHAQNRMLMQLFGGMFATTVVGFLGTIAAIITQA